MERRYLAIDLKSFYASVECLARGYDPLRTHLVVADESRTEKTVCLAVSPSLKEFGISSRARLFEVLETVREINRARKRAAKDHSFTGKSVFPDELEKDPSLALDFVIAPPRMRQYLETSTQIFEIYKRFVSPEDIHVYSIDEAFLDVTDYLKSYRSDAVSLAMRIVQTVFVETGITATAGVGSNLYLAKVAMDVVAKHVPPDENGVRIAELNETTYRKLLWDHRPLTDFWRVGKGYSDKLNRYGLYTMGDIALRSLSDEDFFYNLFGVNAELLIDHAWGYEPVTLREIKSYRPETNSMSSGQVLKMPYSFEKARLVLREMADLLSFDLVEKGLVTRQIVLTVGYDKENLAEPTRRREYRGEVKIDRFGRSVPKHGRGTENLEEYTSSTRRLTEAAVRLFERVADPNLLVRRLNLCFCRVIRKEDIPREAPRQLDLFHSIEELSRAQEEEAESLETERRLQSTVLTIRKKFGKNALVKGMDLQEGATTIERNDTIGGHRKG